MQSKIENKWRQRALALALGFAVTACSSTDDTDHLKDVGSRDSLGSPVTPSELPPEITQGTGVGADADPDNVIDNGSFERGIAPWGVQGSGEEFGDTSIGPTSDDKYTGRNSLLIQSRSDTWHSATLGITDQIEGGQYYAVSAWVKLLGTNASSAADVVIRQTVGNNAEYPKPASAIVNSSEWTLLEGIYQAPANIEGMDLTFYIEVADVNADFMVDDVLIKPTDPPAPETGAVRVGATRDYANNGSVESSATYWYSGGNALITRSNVFAWQGDYSLLTYNRTQAWEGPNSRLEGLNGVGTYVASVAVRFEEGVDPQQAQLTLHLPGKADDAEVEEFSAIVAGETTADGWTVLRGVFDLPAEDLEEATVYVEVPSSESADFYVDHLRITQLVGLRNLIPTGDVESGLTGWSVIGDIGIEPSGVAAYRGAYGIHVTRKTANWQGPSIDLSGLEANKTYSLSGWVKMPEGAPQVTAKLTTKLRYPGQTNEDADYITIDSATVGAQSDTTGQSEWVKLTGELTYAPTETPEEFTAYFEIDNETAEFYVDEFSVLEAGAEVVPPPYDFPTPVPTGRDGLAGARDKYFGSALSSYIPETFRTYWNQVTPENSSKWGVVEAERDVMDWTQLDMAYAYAKANQMPFKFHTLVWGSQFPDWIEALSEQEQREEVEEWYAAVAERYPEIDSIDVVNEALKESAQAPFLDAIGGAGDTGFDWVIWSFEKAREYFPTSQLLINDYGIVNDANERGEYVGLIGLLIERDLVDGIGIQSHYFNMDDLTAAQLDSALDDLAALGLPIHISELDLSGDEATQAMRYQELFPVMWEHPAVAGVTVWNYIWGETWRHESAVTALLNEDGTPRAAMTWLEQYFSQEGDQ